MKIILKYIITNVRERKTRTTVMLLSILLSTTLLFVSFSIGSSYESAQRKMARGMAGSATVSVTLAKNASSDSEDGRVSGVTPDVIPHSASIKAMAGIIGESALYHENGYYETIDLIAADLTQLAQINPPRLSDGGVITGFEGNLVILPDRFTSKYGIQKGDTVTFELHGSSVELEVAQIAAYDTVFLRHTRGATALVPLSTLAALLGQDGYSEILLEPAEGISTQALMDELAAVLPEGGYHVSQVVQESQIKADARQKTMPFFLISFFSLTMSIFIIYSSYKVITLDRLPVIGTFRSIGATQKTVTRILLLESLLYGVTGGLAGIPLGMLVLKVILSGMGRSLSQGIEIPIVISPLGVAVSLCVAVIVSLLSAWLPVRRASRLPIKNVVLGTVEEKQVPRRYIVAAGAILFLASIFLPGAVPEEWLYPAGAFSLLGLIVATIWIVPLLANLVSFALERLYGFLFGNVGRLAARNMRDNRNAAQNITLLFISISAVIAIRTVGSFVAVYVGDVFRDAQLTGFADGSMGQDFIDSVHRMDGIREVLPLYVLNGEIQGNGYSFSRLEATDDLTLYTSMLAVSFTEPSMEKQAAEAFETQRAVLLNENCLEQTGVAVGDTLSLTNGSVQEDYWVAGSFKSRATDTEAVIPSAWAVTDFGADTYGFLAYTAADPDAIMIQIRELFADTPNWSRTVEEFNADALTTVGAFLQPMHSMTYFILLLATVGVVNNLLINYMQRRRSIAMYKSVGLSDRQNCKLTLLEGFSSGLTGALTAIFVSYMEIRTIFLVAGPKISMTPEFDAATFLSAGAMGILVTLIGSIVPILKSRGMKLVEEIKFE